MLLRNLDQTNELCNETRLIVTRIEDRVIEAEIITGTNIGEKVIIPRIILTNSKSDLPFIQLLIYHL
ncbi:ATP-dependent DNA helicase PIF1 [Apostasia shenzhenica]|uniref:ATP-dependent DNA helicase PIF1 n=1 Tax=Apostasia shenzhenica TaxID=1088818 RepID=A0A2H9ZZ70_9ASPA|nr:ATP-dependent DNA helicase PIF1 [Apostasia shenzhenica]